MIGNKKAASFSVLLALLLTLLNFLATSSSVNFTARRFLERATSDVPGNARWVNATSSRVQESNKTELPVSNSKRLAAQTDTGDRPIVPNSFSAIVQPSRFFRAENTSAPEILFDVEPPYKNTSSGMLWIHVIAWGEGLTAWRHTFVDVVLLAMKVNATVVEPCVVNGRLKSCSQIRDLSSSIRFRDVLKLDHLLSIYPNIATYEEFQRSTGYTTKTKHDAAANNVFHACLTSEGKEMQEEYQTSLCGKLGVNNTSGSSKQPALDQAVRASKNSTAILEFLGLWRHKLDVWVPEKKRRADLVQEKARDVMLRAQLTSSIGFADERFQQVQSMLKNFNITKDTPFAAIQWRPEVIEDLDYMACAESLLRSRDIISQRDKIPKENFVLISPFSKRKELQWGGVAKLAEKHNKTSIKSLDLLLDSGFRKLEQTFGDDIADGTFLAVWDFILAMTATSFTTCAKDLCSDEELCSACNHRGKSSVYALDMREWYEANRTATHECWPT